MLDNSTWKPNTKLLSKGDTEAQFAILFPANLEIFKGHFPEFSITPGLVIYHSFAQLLKEHFQIDISSANIPSIKFTRPILPDLEIHLHIQIHTEQNQVSFECKDKEHSYAKAKIGIQLK